MDPGFEAHARAVFRRAGIEVTDDDLTLVELVQSGYEGNAAALDQADTTRFPHTPVDPSRTPEQ